MADIRIKDLASTATTTASDDFMAVDGTTNGTRKMNAATPAFLTSVTTPSLTSPALTDLTLAGGSSGASLVLGQSSGGATFATSGTGAAVKMFRSTQLSSSTDYLFGVGDAAANSRSIYLGIVRNSGGGYYGLINVYANTAPIVLQDSLQTDGNVLIGGTTNIAGSGGLKIFGTTAGSAGAGALVVTGGLSAGNNGNASYFGGAVTSNGAIASAPASGWAILRTTGASAGDSSVAQFEPFGTQTAANPAWFTGHRFSAHGNFAIWAYNGSNHLANYLTIAATTGAATFAGAVSVGADINFAGEIRKTGSASGYLAAVTDTTNNGLYWDDSANTLNLYTASGAGQIVLNQSGAVRFHAYGAGTATFDSAGNITSVSDARLKNITGTFTKGLAEIVKLTPKLYTWKLETGLVTDDINATLIAQDLIAAGLSEAVATYRTVSVMEDDVQSAEDIAAGKPVTQHAKLDANGKAVTKRVDANYSVSDRTVIAALVNAVKELKAEIDALKASK